MHSHHVRKYDVLGRSQVLVVLAFFITAIWYFTWRLTTLNASAMGFSVALLAAELFGFGTALLHVLMTWRLTERQARFPRSGLSVDVFVTTINEPVELVRKTLLAAKNMHYPHDTWLLDDGDRSAMREMARELGVHYLARGDRRDAKAGNLNNALKRTKGEFIAVFDADHAPHPDFLTRTLGYFDDSSVAFVQTPQDFYNLDSYQHRRGKSRAIWTEQSLFFRVIQRGKDYWNAAFFCGSCALLRRSALDSVGGFATGTVTEDLHTSLRLHKKGFRSVYHAQPLAFGLAPASIAPFLRQRIRWGQGAMQVWRREGVLFAHGLTFVQRLNYLASMVTYFDGWQKAFFYAAPVVVLVAGIMPIHASGGIFLLHFIPYYVLTFWVFEEVGRGYGRSIFIEQYNMARFFAFAWSTLFVLKRYVPFRVTPKTRAAISPSIRLVLPQIVVLACNWTAIAVGTALFLMGHHLPHDALLVNIVWAAINGALALAVLKFTRQIDGYRRRDYRFPVPLVARMSGRHSRLLLTVDDISSGGCRLYGPGLKDMPIGEEVSGELLLPAAVLRFRARVSVHFNGGVGDETYLRAVGCSFTWQSLQQRDFLDLYLYGSELQWTLQRLSERVPTPLERLFALVAPSATGSSSERLPSWAAMMYSFVERGGYPLVGLVSVPAGEEVVLFQPPSAYAIRGRSVTFSMQKEFRLVLDEVQRLHTPLGPLYLCRTRPAGVEPSTVVYTGERAIKKAA